MTITQRECIVCASVLTDQSQPGPNVSMVIAHHHYMRSPEASKVAEALIVCIRKGIPAIAANVQHELSEQYKKWVRHRVFRDGLPLSCAESVAAPLLPHYRNKRILSVISRAYEVIIDNPESAHRVAKTLILALQDCT